MSADNIEAAEATLRRLEATLAGTRALYARRKTAAERAEELFRLAEADLEEVSDMLDEDAQAVFFAREALAALRAGGEA